MRDTYEPVEESEKPLIYKNEELELRVGIDYSSVFYSIGMLGMPIVPTRIDTSDQNKISLVVSLTLNKEHDFSFDPFPCLSSRNSNLICPSKIIVSAKGMYQDDGTMYKDKRRRWQHISNFFSASENDMNLPVNAESVRVDRKLIYKHYNYSGAQKWDYLKISIYYNFKCKDACPDSLNLDMTGVALVDNRDLLSGEYIFEKIREKDYKFITPVQ